MHTSRTNVLCVAFVAALVGCAVAHAADWQNWRGPNHDGISSETDFKTTWQKAPKKLWEQKIGSAFSSFVCADGKAYTCGTADKQQVLFCFDAETGREIWKKPFEKQRKDAQGGDGTRATPTIDDGHVYILGGHGLLLCVKADGTEVWKHQFNNAPHWGYSGSVLIEGDLAIVSPGKSDGALAALDKKTGKPAWKCGSDQAGYSTPYPFTFNDKRYIAGFLGKAAIIVEAATGRQVWSMPWKTSYDVNASTPLYHDGHLFFSSGYGHGSILLKLRADGDKLAADKVWESDVLRNKFHSAVLYEGNLYSGDEQSLKCVEFLTGKQRWVKRRTKHATVVLANGHLIVLTEKGKLQIAKASPDAYKPIAEADVLSGRCWTVPTLSNGRLYARNLDKAICLDLRTGS